MKESLFRSVVDSLAPYAKKIKKVDLFGMGEPLLDPAIFDRISYMKELGFHDLAISTNADLLTKERQQALLGTGIETVIFSIDGATKKTHEKIRAGTTFEKVKANCESTIRMRDDQNKSTRFILRYIRQADNKDEWEDFRAFWQERLSPGKRDQLIAYDVNTMGGSVFTKKELLGDEYDEQVEKLPCHQVYDRLIILIDGTVPLCCEDVPYATVQMGNVEERSPMDIFNGKTFGHVRNLHSKQSKNKMLICGECTMLYSEKKMQVF
jgi:sulfatase maturation enzyme AslB (radical SAM superfamily)